MLVRDVNLRLCDTSIVRGLTRQIIDELGLLVPNVLVPLDGLNIQFGPAANPFLQLPARNSLARVIDDRGGKRLSVTHAYRTPAQQLLLRRMWEKKLCRITAAARPGRSNHEGGLALDIPTSLPDFWDWKAALERHGWRWYGAGDRPHFDYMERAGTRRDIGSRGVEAFQLLWNRNNPNDPIKPNSTWGDETEKRMDLSPVDGFSGPRPLMLTEPPLYGDDVRRLQEALSIAGFGVDLSETFDEKTEAVVKQFQEHQGLAIDGIVGLATLELMGQLEPEAEKN
jgi:hypothetical protein